MRVVWTFVLLVACNGVGQTGPRGLKGRLLTSDGRPIADQYIHSLEQGVQTAEDGSFAVRWKEPNAFVLFERGRLEWKRRLQPDDPPEVDLQLPPLQDGEFSCRTEMQCRAEVTWDVGNGLTAHETVECGERTPVVRMLGIPAGLPEVQCATIRGDLELNIRDDGGRLVVQSKPQARPVIVTGAPEGEPCQYGVFDGDVAEGLRTFVGLEPDADTWAWARCRDRVGTPVAVSPRAPNLTDTQATVKLEWSATGVDLVLTPPVPEPRGLTISHATEDGKLVWQLRAEPGEDGVYRLPPLPRGEYRLGFGAPTVFGMLNPPKPEVPGELLLVAVEGEWGAVGGYVGALRLEEDLAEGTVEFHGAPPIFDMPEPPADEPGASRQVGKTP